MSMTDLEGLLRDAYAASKAGGTNATYRKTEQGRDLLIVGLSTLRVEHRMIFLAVDGDMSVDDLARHYSAIPEVAAILLELEREGYIAKI